MSLRIDTSEWISNCLIIGETGLGVLAENIPSTGTDGESPLYNDLSLPADNGKEIRALILTQPSDGTLFMYEDGSFIFSDAADGEYTFTYQLDVDSVPTGSPATVTIIVGSGVVLSSTIVSTATIAANLATGINLSSNLYTVTTTSASLSTAIQLSTQVTAIASLAASLETGSSGEISSSLNSSSNVVAELSTEILLSTFLQARATGTAYLVVGTAGGISPSAKLTIKYHNPKKYKISFNQR